MSSNPPPPITPNTNTNADFTPDDTTAPSVPVVTEASQSSEEFDQNPYSDPSPSMSGSNSNSNSNLHTHVRSSPSYASSRHNSRDWSIENAAELVDPDIFTNQRAMKNFTLPILLNSGCHLLRCLIIMISIMRVLRGVIIPLRVLEDCGIVCLERGRADVSRLIIMQLLPGRI